jgi:hypothetical protein
MHQLVFYTLAFFETVYQYNHHSLSFACWLEQIEIRPDQLGVLYLFQAEKE